ncbi:winged helix DNA-binding domain-containing protein [Microbacterium awajiense]|uniref:Winged helix DNA-binding domain-containing protein n=1 Tax=Microbacterium awajiense TaxID=415214 RepID=A0ABP7AG78_9MICO
MDTMRLRAERLRSHRLSAPAASLTEAASHLLAVQSQEFWGGRWALAVRTRGIERIAEVDALFDRGELVRSWTMRGTLHTIPARDLAWVLGVTGDRQFRSAASRHRRLGIDGDMLRRVERAVRGALRGDGRLTRAELFDLLGDLGIDPRDQRGVHLLQSLCLRGVIVQAGVVPREVGPAREQYFVLVEEWIEDAAPPADPLAEFFVRYIDGHGPAGAADFAWWTGLPLGTARVAAEAAGDRVREIDDGLFVGSSRPRPSTAAAEVVALPPFDEFYISYADRTVIGPPEILATVGPGANGMVRPLLVARGEIVATWAHSLAVGRHIDEPVRDLLLHGRATDDELSAALERYRRFVAG